MLRSSILVVILFLCVYTSNAQNSVGGTVYDYQLKTTPLSKVNVRNLTNQQATTTNSQGFFSIAAKTGDLLEFSLLGYHTDTLFLIDLKPKSIFLPENSVDIESVVIERTKVSERLGLDQIKGRESKLLSTKQPSKYDTRAGGLSLALGYGKMRREQQKAAELLEREKIEDQISQKFTAKKIEEFLQIPANELKDFMDLYRPTVSEVKEQNPFNYDLHLINSYHKWLKTPPEQRKLPPLPKLGGRP